ncbi:MAG: sodium:calcium antiporter [Burkholderiaceae bacterium]
MDFLNFKSQPLWMNLAVFAASGSVVWMSGTKISRYADVIARKSGIGHVAVGIALLGSLSSLPEIAVSLSSAISQSPVLAVNNLLGGVAMQVAILAVADAFIGRQPLTVTVTSPTVLLQGTLNVLLLTLVAAGIALDDVAFLGIGAWPWAILMVYGLAIWNIAQSQNREPWIAANAKEQKQKNARAEEEVRSKNSLQQQLEQESLRKIGIRTAIAAGAILVAGFFLSQIGDAIAEQTGLGQNFVGAVLLALSTSLPEISIVFAAVRLKQYEMVIAEIFGSNAFSITLIFLVDALYAGKPVLGEVSKFSLFAALLAIFITTLFLVGLVERRDRTVARMGIDSLAVLIAYAGGLFLLYQLR